MNLRNYRRDIGRQLKEARDAKGVTQAAMADAINMGPENYSRIERGLQAPRIEHLASIMRTLELHEVRLNGLSITLQVLEESGATVAIIRALEPFDEELRRRILATVAAFLRIG